MGGMIIGMTTEQTTEIIALVRLTTTTIERSDGGGRHCRIIAGSPDVHCTRSVVFMGLVVPGLV